MGGGMAVMLRTLGENTGYKLTWDQLHASHPFYAPQICKVAEKKLDKDDGTTKLPRN